MKRRLLYLLTLVAALGGVSSCVQDGYNLEDVNKEGAFSHDNGILLQIGSLDTISFDLQAELPIPVDVEYTEPVRGLFSDEMFDYFVYDNKGREEPLGDISFEADFIAGINDAEGKLFSDINLSTKILNENGEDTGISVENQTFKANISTPQPYVVKIKKDDVLKLKGARLLELTFSFQTRQVELSDYALIENINVKLSGGVKIAL
ncbi:MAG: hypothetical protein LBS05_03950 [Tannerellaceae bacterium]|jgi:hypothetical protein|nr:hypothetical protein [Tannerellaceae bacterium]